jgi:hypothetical protein
MSKRLRSAFQGSIISLPISSLISQREITPEARRSIIFRQVVSSVREIGLIEPLIVFPQEDRGFLVLDGHLRVEALKENGIDEAKCLLATDDESYTYNKRVNHIPPVAQHFMLLAALKSGVSEERIATVLNVDVSNIRDKTRMLDGICPEVVQLLRDRSLSPVLFTVLRKMKPAIQIATAELMLLRNDCSVSFARTRLALTPPDLLIASTASRQLKADSAGAQAMLEEDTELLVRNLKAVEESYGADILTLTVTSAYAQKLFAKPAVRRYLERNHPGVFETGKGLLAELKPAEAQREMPSGHITSLVNA